MNNKDFNEVVHLIVKEDRRYDPGAYHFLRQALDFTLNKVREKEGASNTRHISGQELAEGIREYALEQYGPMALTLLREWGLEKTEDFGEMVFNLVDYKVFGKTEQDRIEDFRDVYEFEDAFGRPFRPEHAPRFYYRPGETRLNSLSSSSQTPRA
ncbi:MAG: hypothetical protein Q7P63_06725 [Verrucomicrobiota bacterium JB022]|nr:hypothetical protein [Verrucomicrobiota bacterium JB022]